MVAHLRHHRAMTSALKGFPEKFPVRNDDRRPLRYGVATVLSRLYLRLPPGRRLRIVGEQNIPADRPLLLVVNHVSNLDPMLVGGYFPLTLFAMAKREMFVNPVVTWFLAGCNCIPVNRSGGDRRAVTQALAVLGSGGRLLVFLEGTRSRDGRMQRAQPGVGFLARRSGATILPAAISGTDGVETFGGARREAVLRYGVPFSPDVDRGRGDAAIADEIAGRIAALLPPWRRGVYASDPHGSAGAT